MVNALLLFKHYTKAMLYQPGAMPPKLVPM